MVKGSFLRTAEFSSLGPTNGGYPGGGLFSYDTSIAESDRVRTWITPMAVTKSLYCIV